MRDPVEALTCDTPGCDAEITAPRQHLTDRARRAGWQVRAVTILSVGEDPDMVQEDHCPQHHVGEIDRDTVLRRAGGPGGVQPHMLD